MKITVQMPSIYDQAEESMALWERCLLASMDRVKAPGTEITLKPSSLVPNMHGLGARYQNDHDVLTCMLNAEKDGADGVIDYCFFDPALWPARQLLDIPVVGAAEASMHLASYLGRKFAIITPQAAYVQAMDDAIEQYGFKTNTLSHRPVRAIGVTEEEIIVSLAAGKTKDLVDIFVPAARSCIEEGSDAIIIGCGVLGVALTEGAGLREVEGVPIISQAVATIKAIETLVSLKAAGLPTKTRQGFWGAC